MVIKETIIDFGDWVYHEQICDDPEVFLKWERLLDILAECAAEKEEATQAT